MMNHPIRILIADAHPVICEGLLAMLTTQPDFKVVGTATDGLTVETMMSDLRPNIIFFDLAMPNLHGFDIIHHLRVHHPETNILLMTSFADDEQLFLAIQLGALGYLLKDAPHKQLFRAIRSVSKGQGFLQPTIAFKILQLLCMPPKLPITPFPLTVHEFRTLQLIAQGNKNHEIATTMGIPLQRVIKNTSNIVQKLQFAYQTETMLCVGS